MAPGNSTTNNSLGDMKTYRGSPLYVVLSSIFVVVAAFVLWKVPDVPAPVQVAFIFMVILCIGGIVIVLRSRVVIGDDYIEVRGVWTSRTFCAGTSKVGYFTQEVAFGDAVRTLVITNSDGEKRNVPLKIFREDQRHQLERDIRRTLKSEKRRSG